jgi:hypothetical protein
MATFKVGQRVRLLFHSRNVDKGSPPIGSVGTIVGALNMIFDGSMRHEVAWDSFPTRLRIFSIPEQLAPLTDPGADAFLAHIKRLGSEPVNDAPKVEVTR